MTDLKGTAGFYRPELDGLRFLAFLAVFVCHSQLFFELALLARPGAPELTRWLAGMQDASAFGVALFFVLSSYLLTSLLLLERERTGGIDAVGFWVRRALRIWPLYFTFLGALLLLGERGLLPFFLFVGNWSTALHGYPPGSFAHLWSISVEEQFYLCWPLVLMVSGSRARFFAAALLLGWVARLGFWARWEGTDVLTQFAGTGLYCNLASWVDCLALGALIAVWRPPTLPRRRSLLTALLGLACWAGVGRFLYEAPVTAGSAVVGYFLIAAGGALLLWSALGDRGWLTRPGMVYLGRISYGLYVFHWPIFSLLERWLPGSGLAYRVWLSALALGATVTVSSLSYRFLEWPFLRMKQRFTHVSSSQSAPASPSPTSKVGKSISSTQSPPPR